METYLGVGGETEHGCIEKGEEIVMGLPCPAFGLGIFQTDTLEAQLCDNTSQERRGILQIAQYLDKGLIIEAKAREMFYLIDR